MVTEGRPESIVDEIEQMTSGFNKTPQKNAIADTHLAAPAPSTPNSSNTLPFKKVIRPKSGKVSRAGRAPSGVDAATVSSLAK